MSFTQLDKPDGTGTIRRVSDMLKDILNGERSEMDGEHPESLRAVGQRLELLIVALGYRHKVDFAAAVGITPQVLNHYLHGTRDMPWRVRQKLHSMGAHPGWLYHGSEDGLTVAFVQRLRAAELILDQSPRQGRRGP